MAGGNGLGDAYKATLTRLRAQKGNKSRLGLTALMWVLNSQGPLRADDLRQALGVEIGSVDLDQNNVPSLKTILSSCLGLVVVEASSSTVRLVHFTLQEYLSNDLTLFRNPHSTIAEVCLTYLNFPSIRDLGLEDVEKSAPPIPFLRYASHYWGEHARMRMTENVKLLVSRLLDRFEEHISATVLLLDYDEDGFWFEELHDARGRTGFTGLHGVAFLGIVEILSAVLEMKEWDVNARDCCGRTAFMWAAERGHGTMVKMLLEREDINPNQADKYLGVTPLICATDNGHEGVVKILLEREDISPDVSDPLFEATPLSLAADNGHVGIVKLLLEREDVNPNQQVHDSDQSLLCWAAENGYAGVMEMFLGRKDVNPNQADSKYGQPPLSWAAESGHEGVVKMLLQREDINPEQLGTNTGSTALSLAAGAGHKGVVKMLLEREDVNPNRADTEYGRTPLSWAACNGHEGVVKILLEHTDIHITIPDFENQTPLTLALSKGHHGVVRILQRLATSIPTE